MSYFWTSEAVGPGHPDKVADQISDAILDAFLEQDTSSKVACETMVKGNRVILAGEITSHGSVDYESVVRRTVRDIGYTKERNLGFDDTCEVMTLITQQSPEINKAVVRQDSRIGAGDQGIMFGYAVIEPFHALVQNNYMPSEIHAARELIWLAQNLTRSFIEGLIYPDCKSQVTFEYEDAGVESTTRISHIVLSLHHHPSVSVDLLKNMYHEVILPQFSYKDLVDDKTIHLINPAGPWTFGGPAADAGLTGRKIVADNYGAECQIGGGAFSGKDPTKVDRSAAYAARHIAKNLVAYGVAGKAKVQLAYAIGEPYPISVRVDTMGTCRPDLTEDKISKAVLNYWDLSPEGIINRFQLRNPIYRATAAQGHFGIKPQRFYNGSLGWTWEAISSLDDFLNSL